MRIDPDGRNDYTIDEDGNIILVLETEDDFDMLYTAADYGADCSNGIKITDQNILSSLENSRGELEDHVKSNSADDMFKVFLFASNNSKVEWGIARGKVKGESTYMLGTYRDEKKSPKMSKYGMDIIAAVHSHPGEFFNIRQLTEQESIGFNPFSETYSYGNGNGKSDFAQKVDGDVGYLNYVYFPNSGNLRYVTGDTRGALFVQNIRGNFRNFYFGTLNHR